MRDYLLGRDALMFTYLNPESVGQLYTDHASGRHDNHKILFSLVVFEQWLRAMYPELKTTPRETLPAAAL